MDHAVHPIPVRSLVQTPVVFRLMGQTPDLATLYAIPAPAEILHRVEASGLRGRGGAAYPTGAKWRAAARQPGPTRYVVVNGDEGDPGSFVDRLLLESAPHAVRAGLDACAAAIDRAGGGPAPGRRWKMALVGGPMGTVIPVEHFDVRLAYDTLPGLGHGGVVVLDDTVSAAALAAHLFDFARGESCGNCAPCRIGTAQLAQQRGREGLERLLDTLELGSLCGFGQGVPRPIRDLLAHFPGELFGGAR